VKPNPDPLRTDPVATVIESCVGCGLCGEVAHAAGAVPVVLPRRGRAQTESWDALHGAACIVMRAWLGATERRGARLAG
jgi:indolepyruvate ferredoxin oxidoreductase alpha subunit